MSRKTQEKQDHFCDHSAKIDGSRTIPGEGRRQPPKKVVCSGAQTHSQKPFAHHETSSWQDVDTLFSSDAVRTKLITA